MAPKTIEIKNIVCGDLPYDGVRGDFYVCITVGANPDMVTALQEDHKPKVVHFPEVLQLKVRDSALANRVVITVKELNIAGSETLCEVKISASSIIDWSEDDEPLKRFQMKPMNSDIERETPPWIAMEFSSPTEPRVLDKIIDKMQDLKVILFLESKAPGRTRVQPDYHETKLMDGSTLGTRTTVGHTYEGKHAIADFKQAYTLLDDGGNPIEEPDEHDLAKLRTYRHCLLYVVHTFDCFVFLAIFLYAACRIYVWSCYRQFVWLTMAYLNAWPLLPTTQNPDGKPISDSQLEDVVNKCKKATVGTGAITGQNPCRPSYNQTLVVCNLLPDDNRPEAFVGLVHDWTGLDIKGFTCAKGVCEFRDLITQYDQYAIGVAVVLFLLTRICKCEGNKMVKHKKKEIQKKSSLRMKTHKDQDSADDGFGTRQNRR